MSLKPGDVNARVRPWPTARCMDSLVALVNCSRRLKSPCTLALRVLETDDRPFVVTFAATVSVAGLICV